MQQTALASQDSYLKIILVAKAAATFRAFKIMTGSEYIKLPKDEKSWVDLPEDGIFLLDKRKGVSSFGEVYRLRRVLRDIHQKKVKVGHCGTLDPIATGLLVLVSGKNTKRAEEFSKLDKVYEAEATLGVNSTTYDSEGEIKQISDRVPSEKEVVAGLNEFIGRGEQMPPIFSAIKIGGKRAYKLAREGREVKMVARQIEIFEIELIEYAYPKVVFKVHVSSGTYVRSIIFDLGAKLGTGALMSGLRRTKIGKLEL